MNRETERALVMGECPVCGHRMPGMVRHSSTYNLAQHFISYHDAIQPRMEGAGTVAGFSGYKCLCGETFPFGGEERHKRGSAFADFCDHLANADLRKCAVIGGLKT